MTGLGRIDGNRRLLAAFTAAGTVAWLIAIIYQPSVWTYVYWVLAVVTVVQLARVHRADNAKAGCSKE